MKSKFLVMSLSLFVFIFLLSSERIINLNSLSENSGIQITSGLISNTKIHLSLSEIYISEGINYTDVINFTNGDLFSEEIGKSRVPYYRKMIVIPDKGNPVITVSNIKRIKVDGYYNIQPTQHPLPEIRNYQPQFVKDEVHYTTDAFYPGYDANVMETGIIRNSRYATIGIFPLQYNPVTKEIFIITECDITISFEGKGENEIEKKIPFSKRWESIYRMMFWNWDYVKDSFKSLPNPITGALSWSPDTWFNEGDYLILVVSDEMTEKIKELAAWRTKLGYTPVIKQVPNTITPTQLRDTIAYCYLNWSIPLDFVLIVGEGEESEVTNHIECHRYYDGGSGYGIEPSYIRNDHFYSLMPDSLDRHSDLFVSRFPAEDSIELDIWIDKTINYEMSPPSGE